MRLHEELESLTSLCQTPGLTYQDLLKHMSHREHNLLTLFFACPFLFPIPLPGLSIPFGIVIFVAGTRTLFGLPPWLPRWIAQKSVPLSAAQKTLSACTRFVGHWRRWLKPRISFFHRHPGSIKLNGLLIAVCGGLLALPLPPFTNSPPALAIVLLSLGSLEEDGLFIVLGYLVFLGNVALFSLIAFFGYEGFQRLIGL